MLRTPSVLVISICRPRRNLFARGFAVFGCFVLLGAFFAINASSTGQESSRIDKLTEAARLINEEFGRHSNTKGLLDEEFQRIQSALKETEDDIRKLQDEALRKQVQLVQLDWERSTSMALQQYELEQFDYSNQQSGSDQRYEQRLASQNNQLRQMNESIAWIEQTSARMDLRQIDAAARLVVQRRLQTYREGEKLYVDVQKWNRERASFFKRYWRFTDPSRIYSNAECERLLGILNERSSENYPANLASSVLRMRMGKSDEAIRELDRFILDKTRIQAPAFAARSLAYATRGTIKKAESDMATAMKIDRNDPSVRYFHAMLAASGREWSEVEEDAKILLKLGEYEVDTRRLLAVVYATRAAKSPKLGTKVLDQAKLLCALQLEPVWYDRLLLSVAFHLIGKSDEAVATATAAVEAASDEQVDFAKEVLAKIKAGKPVELSILRL